MPHRLLLTALVVSAFAGSYLAQRHLCGPEKAVAPPADCRRIVSMAPSITETLFALGLGDRVIGVSRYCDFPPEAKSRPQIGGFLDPNLEAIVALQPDLVVALSESQASAAALEQLDIPTLTVCHQNIDGILESFRTIGRACGAEARGREMLAEIEARIERVRMGTAGLDRPRVMVVANRVLNTGNLEEVYVASNDGHLDRIVELAGGRNAFPSSSVRFPTVSQEGILTINPEVIIDLVTESDVAQIGRQKILADWQQVAEVDAVRNGRVYVLADDRAVRPGPSFVLLLEHFARLIHEGGS